MTGRHRSLSPEFGPHNDRSVFDRAVCMRGCVRMGMGMRHSAMGGSSGRRKRDQNQCSHGQDGRCDGPDGHDAFYIAPGFEGSGSASIG
jgi:hypothetical protein